MVRITLIVVSVMVAASCNNNKRVENKVISLLVEDTALHLNNGVWYYKQAVLNGTINEFYPSGTKKLTKQISNGRNEGITETWYINGKRESYRWYLNGEKDSVHSGWWPNGNIKFEYHFKEGEYNGMFTEWYKDGKIYQQVMYAKGKDLYGKGWRESGTLFMNFISKNGRRYGLNNSNFCYSLKNENVSVK
ncbi:MAG: hypothetical protein ABIO04_08270 [Ferruginibacter sp.]